MRPSRAALNFQSVSRIAAPALAVLALLAGSATAPAQTTTTTESSSPRVTVSATTVTRQLTTSVTGTVKVQIQGSRTVTRSSGTTTKAGSGSDDGGLPGWAWALIGAGAVGLLAAAFAAGRRHRQEPPQGPTAGGSPPGMPS